MENVQPIRSTSLKRNFSKSSFVGIDGNKLTRQRSLVRPERERNDPNSRLYHYRQRAAQGQEEDSDNIVVPSTTGNYPTRTNSIKHLERRSTLRKTLLRRGKSILGRDDRHDTVDGAIEYETDDQNEKWYSNINPWLTYCYILTCCIPKSVLRCAGVPDGPAQIAWREKIGLVSFILFIMGCVGFLTFGFTQVVCPTPPLSVRGGHVNNGYLIIDGWAYMLASWSHPIGIAEEPVNILYPPIDAGGMDATFLFQTIQSACDSVFIPLQGSRSNYFPCQLFNPNQTEPPSPSQYTNRTNCHTSAASRTLYQSFINTGVPRSDGNGFDKAARVYYNWEDITSDSALTIYNGNVLNLKLLSSLPTSYFSYNQDGLIAAILANMSAYSGRDITMTVNSNLKGQWRQEAKCLASTIRVGTLDTISLGCMASDIVLYVSLVVILGVIMVKFVLAVIFGWFLSWKLGNFKEGVSYAERMKREAEIENWTSNMQNTGPLPKPRIQSTYYGNSNKRRSLFPQSSRFTQPMPNSTRFDIEKNASMSTVWKTPNTALSNHTNRQTIYGGDRQSMWIQNSSTTVPILTNNSNQSSSVRLGSERAPRRSSVSSYEVSSTTDSHQSFPSCPLPLSPHVLRQPSADYMPFNFQLAHTVCLVTCYSEGESGIRTTLDSIATSDYPNSHKLLLVICDGLITGHGETRSTPDICVDMMRDLIVPANQVQPYSYIALADGSKQNNMAKVYAGYYKYDNQTVDRQHQQRVPMITIVKCGTEPERAKGGKPGNRGKRDSQIILMQFMQKVMFDERMTTMEYELFNCIWRVAGVPPDAYEIVLMVDADTKLFPDALSRLISCAVKDPEISGLCGETKIANKTDSWVTMIQVFEYYISHHQSKAFESIFGGVTCLPGCFCMYRIKAPKGPDGYWVPILANPDIVQRYSENVVDTLHKKNLLLLGEDRYLSTLMLRTFPNRKMLFVPQAVCKTVVPDTFMVLLSQRRRWINSTIHNLMELLFVHDLCGTFCFSMQFVVFMELVGTLALPAAISFTIYLVVMAILGQPALIPLILLALILGLPAVLIVMTSRKVVYVGWMLIYLFSIPIWNFVLPTYAYWHFDDFSWGDTRKVEGVKNDKGGHADKDGEFDSSMITMKKWNEYEKDRRIKEAKERNLPIPRFASNKRPGLDVFRDSLYVRKSYRPKSSGSNDSDMPLTDMNYIPSAANYSTRALQQSQNQYSEISKYQAESVSNESTALYNNHTKNTRPHIKDDLDIETSIPLTNIDQSTSYHSPKFPYRPNLNFAQSDDESDSYTKSSHYLQTFKTPTTYNPNSSSSWANPAPQHQNYEGSENQNDTRQINIPKPPPHGINYSSKKV